MGSMYNEGRLYGIVSACMTVVVLAMKLFRVRMSCMTEVLLARKQGSSFELLVSVV